MTFICLKVVKLIFNKKIKHITKNEFYHNPGTIIFNQF